MFKALHIVALFFLLLSLQEGKNDTLLVQEANFIHGRTSRLDSLIGLLGKDNAATILHIGDSHIEMRSFPEGICEGLQQGKIRVTKGWFLPAGIFTDLYDPNFKVTRQSKAFRTDNARTSHPELRIGITGRTFALEAKENRIWISSTEAVSEIEILHDTRSDLQIKPVGKKHKKAVVTLQEITENGSEGSGLTVTKITLPAACLKFELKFTKKEAERAHFYGFRINQGRVQYSNFGLSGARYDHVVMSRDLQKQAKAFQPSLVIVTLGTNDSYQQNLDTATFEWNMQLFVESIRAVSPKTVFVFMTAPDTRYKGNKPVHQPFVNHTIRQFCEKNRHPYWDWNAVMGGENSMEKWENSPYAYGDYLHFSKEAYQMFGLAFAEALLRTGH